MAWSAVIPVFISEVCELWGESHGDKEGNFCVGFVTLDSLV